MTRVRVGYLDARHVWASWIAERDRDEDTNYLYCVQCGRQGETLKPTANWRRMLIKQIYRPSPLYFRAVMGRS